METQDDNPLVQSLLDSAKKVIGCSEPTTAAFATDASSFTALGIPTPVFGPGNGREKAHTADEFIEIDQLEISRLAA